MTEQNKFECDLALVNQANTYRLHQDNLRWTLLAGYAAFFTAIANTSLSIFLSIVVFIMGNCYLLLLAIENWYYNLFADYVKEIEANFKKQEDLHCLDKFE